MTCETAFWTEQGGTFFEHPFSFCPLKENEEF